MALTKSATHLGITYPNAYYKINGYDLREDRVDDGVKKYKADLDIERFTDYTKEFSLGKVSAQIPRQDFTEDGLTFASMYGWYASLPDRVGSVKISALGEIDKP